MEARSDVFNIATVSGLKLSHDNLCAAMKQLHFHELIAASKTAFWRSVQYAAAGKGRQGEAAYLSRTHVVCWCYVPDTSCFIFMILSATGGLGAG